MQDSNVQNESTEVTLMKTDYTTRIVGVVMVVIIVGSFLLGLS